MDLLFFYGSAGYCWFSVSRHSLNTSLQIKINIKTVQNIKSRIQGKKEGKYAKPLAKIQVRAIFHKQDMRRNFLQLQICVETLCQCSSTWSPTWRPEINRNIWYGMVWDGILYLNQDYVTEFCYKRVNISLEELKNIKIILFLIHELFRWVRQPNSPIEVTFFNQHDSSFGRQIQAWSITIPKTHSERRFV